MKFNKRVIEWHYRAVKDGYRGELGELQLPLPEEIKLFYSGEKPLNPQFPSLFLLIYFTFFQPPPQTFPVSATESSTNNNAN